MWSGTTKENDKRTKLRAEATARGRKKAFDEGRITIWSKGETAETDERVARLAKTIRRDFREGRRVAWHAGLSEMTDARVKRKNDDLRQAYASGRLVQWHKGMTAADDPRIAKFHRSRDPIKEYEHVRWSVDEIKTQLSKNTQLALERIENYRNDRKPALHVRCRTCNWEAKVALIFARNDRCPLCSPAGSNGQNEIANWIETLGVKTGRNVSGLIGRQQLDIYVPSHKLAIEFNGLYYHNESAGKDSSYHQQKTDRCDELGIHLFHIFEDEWCYKQDIVKSMIRHRLNMTQRKIFARKCNIVELTPKEKRTYFVTNHIDGNALTITAFALKFNGEIVAALGVRRQFHGKKDAKKRIEIARFCSTLNTYVVGGLSKLMKHVLQYAKSQNADVLTTYVDTRFGGVGNGYATGGMRCVEKTSARFWWTDNHRRFNRLKFKADKKNGLTEAQVAERANVVRIYGCKNLVYEIKV